MWATRSGSGRADGDGLGRLDVGVGVLLRDDRDVDLGLLTALELQREPGEAAGRDGLAGDADRARVGEVDQAAGPDLDRAPRDGWSGPSSLVGGRDLGEGVGSVWFLLASEATKVPWPSTPETTTAPSTSTAPSRLLTPTLGW